MSAANAEADVRIAVVLSTTRPNRFSHSPAAWLNSFPWGERCAASQPRSSATVASAQHALSSSYA